MKLSFPPSGYVNFFTSWILPKSLKLMIPLVILSLFAGVPVRAQTRISGTVRDQSGEALIGVSIKVKDGAGSSSTDINGKYAINVASPNVTLVFSYVGYQTLEVATRGRSVVDVQMSTDSKTLGEVVVVGYGTQRKSDLTGSVASVKPEDIAKRPVTRIDQALQGEVSGVAVTSTSGNPGAPLAVRIRGGNSISSSNEPLYVIDGFIGANITSINVNDIASMEILKDASATAIYGSRGANGVVLITTKSGKSGQTQVNFDTWFSRGEIAKKLDLMNAYDFARTVNDQARAENTKPVFTPPFTDAQLETFKTNSTDWQNELFRESWSQNYQLDVSGGSKEVRYLLSGNMLDQKGVILNSNYKRNTLRANIDATINSRVDLKLNLNAVQAKGRNNSFTGARNDPFSQVTVWDPTSPVRDAQGNFILKSSYGSIQINPISQITNGLYDKNQNDYTATGILNVKILKDLTLSINGSLQNSSEYNPVFLGALTDVGTAGNPRIDIGNVKLNAYQNSNILTYSKEFNKIHSLTLTGVYEIQHSEVTTNGLSAVKITTDASSYYDPSIGQSSIVNGKFTDQSLTSYLGRANYGFKNKYLVTASLRADGSSRLSKGNRYSYFPSAALAWKVTEEPFMKKMAFVSDLKLRASYGQTGNQSVDPYATITKFVTGQNYYFNGASSTGIGAGALASPFLNWEKTAQTDIGLDAAFLKGRITLTADVYQKKTTDLLLSYGIPQYLGGGSYFRNVGSVENKGLEIDLGATPVAGKNLKWNTAFNISFNNNKIVDMGGLNNIVRAVANVQTSILRVGRPFSQFYGYKYLGTWKSSEAAEAALYNKVPGDAKLLDLDGNKVYSPSDRVIIGNGTPKYTFGFSNDVSYKDFTLNMLFQGAQGFDIFSQTLAYSFGGQGDVRNPTNAEILNRWTPENETDIPTFSKTASTPINSSRYIYDGSYIKLKNLSLNYNLPASLLTKMKARSMSVYVSSQNTFTITKYPGYDPEVTNGGADVTQGTEWGVLPNPRTFTLGLRFGL